MFYLFLVVKNDSLQTTLKDLLSVMVFNALIACKGGPIFKPLFLLNLFLELLQLLNVLLFVFVRLIFELKYLFLGQVGLRNYLLHVAESLFLLFLTVLYLLKQSLFRLQEVDPFLPDGVDLAHQLFVLIQDFVETVDGLNTRLTFFSSYSRFLIWVASCLWSEFLFIFSSSAKRSFL